LSGVRIPIVELGPFRAYLNPRRLAMARRVFCGFSGVAYYVASLMILALGMPLLKLNGPVMSLVLVVFTATWLLTALAIRRLRRV